MDAELAKTKWCPFVRYTSGSVASNRWKQSLPEDEPHALNPVACRCIASDCMAWRWLPLMADDAYAAAVRKAADELGDTSSSHSKAAKHVNANRARYGLPQTPFQGFCGLAGRPEVL